MFIIFVFKSGVIFQHKMNSRQLFNYYHIIQNIKLNNNELINKIVQRLYIV
jgi:hypothetical protein